MHPDGGRAVFFLYRRRGLYFSFTGDAQGWFNA